MEITKEQQEWLDALRSGEYKQGQELLVQDDPNGPGDLYCCLGVLASINNALEDENFVNGNSELREVVYRKYNIPSLTVIGMNDGEFDEGRYTNTKSFNEIADYLENFWKSGGKAFD